MITLRIGLRTAALRQPLRRSLSIAGRLGVEAVELDARGELRPDELSETGLRQLRKLLADHGLAVAALSFRTRRGYHVLEDLDRRVEATKRAMDTAYALGAPVVINHIGRVPPLAESATPGDAENPAHGATAAGSNQGDDAARKLLIEVLTDLGAHAQRCGARLAAETGSESGPELARLLSELPPGAVAVDFNPANLIAGGFSPIEAIEALGPSIAHVHAVDADRDAVLGSGQGVPLGSGSADFPALLAALEAHDYHGYLTVVPRQVEDPVTEITQAIEYLRNL